MSYARWSDDSSVYVYAHVGGYIDCCGCTRLHSTPETVEHMQWHRNNGDTIPDYLLDPETYDEHDFIPMCITYMCHEDEGHDGPHTPLKRPEDETIRNNSEVRKLDAMIRASRNTEGNNP